MKIIYFKILQFMKLVELDWLDVEECRELSSFDFGIFEECVFLMFDVVYVWVVEVYFCYVSDDQKFELVRNILEKVVEYGVCVESFVVLFWVGKQLLYNDLIFCVVEYCVNVGVEL